jgi:HSP20 family molecular chaperone IbpA
MHQDDQHGVQVTVDVPGVVSSDDLKVQVLQTQTPNLNCVVQWSGQRPTNHPNVSSSFSERVRLDPSVDCDHLAANLSRGVLRLSAPIILKGKEQPTVEKEEARSIPITEHED